LIEECVASRFVFFNATLRAMSETVARLPQLTAGSPAARLGTKLALLQARHQWPTLTNVSNVASDERYYLQPRRQAIDRHGKANQLFGR
jgi:hypothetical protein